jgi:hypothetical protein
MPRRPRHWEPDLDLTIGRLAVHDQVRRRHQSPPRSATSAACWTRATSLPRSPAGHRPSLTCDNSAAWELQEIDDRHDGQAVTRVAAVDVRKASAVVFTRGRGGSLRHAGPRGRVFANMSRLIS